MKHKFNIALLAIVLMISMLSGCDVFTNLFSHNSADDYFYGMVETESNIALSSLANNKIVDMEGTTLVNTIEKPHGFAFDTDTSIFWVADLNESQVVQYDSNGTYIDSYSVGGQPVNILLSDNTFSDIGIAVFIADRELDQIKIYDVDTSNSIDTTTDPAITIDLSSYLDQSSAIGYIDMYYYDNSLFIVSDEYDGFLIAKFFDESNPRTPTIEEYQYTPIAGDYGALGIVYNYTDDIIFINTGNRILSCTIAMVGDTPEGTFTEVIGDLKADGGYNYTGAYTDLIYTTAYYIPVEDESGKLVEPPSITQHYIYVASGISKDEYIDNNIPHHVIVYSESSTTQNSFSLLDVVDEFF